MIRASLLAALFVVGCNTTTTPPADAGAPPGPTVIMTDKGAVEGAATDAARKFLGIPYVAPLYPNIGVAHSFELPFVFGTNLGGRTSAIRTARVHPRDRSTTRRPTRTSSSTSTAMSLKKAQCDFWDGL